MPETSSVRWRLLLAFLGISAFAVLAAAAATWAFIELGRVVERITGERAPAALSSLELSRQAERIVAAAPALLAAPSEAARAEVAAGIRSQLAGLEALLARLRGTTPDAAAWSAIAPAVDGLGRNLDALDRLVADRLATARAKGTLLSRLSTTVIGAQRLVTPGILVLDSQLAAWRRTGVAGGGGSGEDLARAIAGFVPLQKAQLEIAAVNDNLLKAAAAPAPADLPLLSFPLKRSLYALQALAPELEPSLQGRFLERVRELGALVEGPEGVPAARERELDALGRGERLLAENADLSRGLTASVDRLVAAAETDIATAGVEARGVRRLSTGVLAAVVLASLVSSALIVWLYVDRNLVRRLQALAGSMLKLAGGDLAAPLPAAGGDEIGRMAEALRVFRDTAVEVEEGRLRERQVVLDTIDYGVLILDQSLRVHIHNRAFVRLSGVGDAVLRARPHFRAVMEAARRAGIYDLADADWEAYVAGRLAELEAGEVPPHEWRLPDGRTLEYQCVPLPGGGRMVTYFDLTRLKQVEAELRAAKEQAELASRAKSDFLASMSHELRTPLNAIIGFARLVMRRSKDVLERKQYENLEKILASGQHLLSLINAVLDLSKIEAGRTEVRPVEFALEPLVDQCLRTVEPMVRGDRVGLAKDLEPGLPTLVQDQEKVRQILINLLGNAVKFTEAGTIVVRARRFGGELAVAVSDTGVGIPDEALELVFEKFRQVDSGSTRQHGGTGLGLPISRRLARLMGGDVGVESVPGMGSTFTLRLPLRHAAAPPGEGPAAPVAHATGEAASGGGGNGLAAGQLDGRAVLVIDDDPHMIELLQENLAEEGYRVVGARDGDEGIAKARKIRPDSIVLDIVMPRKDGWQVLHELKAEPATRDIPVVLLSIVDQKNLGYRLGAADYLVKPFEREALLAALSRASRHCQRLLVVDDDPNIVELVRQLLEGAPVAVDAAADGSEALRMIAREPPDVVFLDLLMPGLDGFGVLEALQADPDRRHLPVIVLTAKTLTTEEHALLERRTLAVVEKRGLERGALLREVRRALTTGRGLKPERRS
jgi:signal transduction histidine kinase/CheY-like chemotaxis protein